MIVQYSEFLENVIEKAELYPTANENDHFHYKASNYGTSYFYFKRIKLPQFNLLIQNNKSVPGLISLQESMSKLSSDLKFSQAGISKYIFPYDQIIISYPYACFLHPKFENLLLELNYKRTLSYWQKVELLIEITKGVQDLHEKNICMRNLKSSQIVVQRRQEKNKFSIYFTNFRSAIFCDKKQVIKAPENNHFVAPEFDKKIGSEVNPQRANEYFPADIWSLGIIFYQTFFQQRVRLPFNPEDLQFFQQTPSWLKQFISKMVRKNPRERTKIKDILRILQKARLCSQLTVR